MVKHLLAVLFVNRVLLAELAGVVLLVAGLAVLWGAGAAMLGGAGALLLKSLEWDMSRRGDG